MNSDLLLPLMFFNPRIALQSEILFSDFKCVFESVLKIVHGSLWSRFVINNDVKLNLYIIGVCLRKQTVLIDSELVGICLGGKQTFSHFYFRLCSSRRGMISTKLQGR